MAEPELLTFENGRFIWQDDKDTRHLPEAAGFTREKRGRPWYTEHPCNAAKLAEWADDAAADQMLAVFLSDEPKQKPKPPKPYKPPKPVSLRFPDGLFE